MAGGFADRVLGGVVRHARLVLVLTLLLTLLALSRLVDLQTGGPRLLMDPSANTLLPAGDESGEFYDYVRKLFGNDESLILAVVDDDLFTADNLQAIRRMSRRIEKLKSVRGVVSLANALNIRSHGGDLEIAPFIDEIPEDAVELARLRGEVLSSPIYRGNLVSTDGTATAILIYLRNISEQEFLERGVDLQIQQIADEERGGAEVWLTGGALIKAEMSRLLVRDLMLVVPISLLLMSTVAFLSFRTARGVFVPISTIGISTIWTLAVMADTVGTLNQVTVAAPSILLAVAFAYSVHVLTAHYDALRSGSREEAVLAALRHVRLPVLLTGVTTAAGFLSLLTSPFPAVRQLGGFSALGVMLTTFVTLTYAPALLQLLPAVQTSRQRARGSRFDQIAERLAAFDVRRRTFVLGAGGVVAAISLVGMSRIQIGTDMVENFGPDTEVRRHFDAVNESLEGSNSFFVVIEADYRGAFREPENLRTLEALQEWLDGHPQIGGTTSLADYVKLINRGFHDNESESLRIPDSEVLIAQLLFFGANDEMERFVDSQYRTVSVLVRSGAMGSAEVNRVVQDVEDHLATLPPHLTPTVTGSTVLVSQISDDIALGQALSLTSAFIMIYAILALIFTSFRIGLMALIPNALPVLVYFGALGWTGIRLNLMTGIIAPVVLGIAVDDTIHFMAHFNAAARRHVSERRGVIEALKGVARPVTYTTAALCVGFFSMTFVQMQTLILFGGLASFTLAVAWVVDVTFTPALAARMRVATLWDVLSLDLGPDPQRSIPLFTGLRKTQARIAALMMSIHTFPKGHRLFEVGDMGNEMYVVIEGELAAFYPRDGREIPLGTLERGDALGEVALFHGRRTANVQALTEVRLLRLTQQNLQYLRKRYPRMGAQIHHNLNKILADRLASVTERVG